MKRIELKHSAVIFDEANHRYFLGGKELSGITGMLERQLFPRVYEGVPEAAIEKAASYGKSVHSSIEAFDTDWENDGTQEVQDYISLCSDLGLTHEASEYLVSDNENYASMIDKVYRVNENTFDLADIKTYGAMTSDKLEKVRWQLSICAYIFENQNNKCKVENLYVLHIRCKSKDRISKCIPVKRIPSEVVKELMATDLRGERFDNPYSIPEDIASQEATIRELILAKQDAEAKLGAIKAGILSAMEAQGVKSWATDTMRITRKLPTTRSSFSLADFKAANPGIDTAPYMKASPVAASLSISIA